jgi:hypothetical protein
MFSPPYWIHPPFLIFELEKIFLFVSVETFPLQDSNIFVQEELIVRKTFGKFPEATVWVFCKHFQRIFFI